MKQCPVCGGEVPGAGTMEKPAGRKPKKPFTIRDFIWENFRVFTMVGVTGTMISLIPNMGSRILGASWIVDAQNVLPLFLSIIIFFGSIFLTICFLLIFSLVFEGRRDEEPEKRIMLGSRTFTWYRGDVQRLILLGCLLPMWFGLTMFFVLLMPLIPNNYSWLFAAVVGLACIPLAVYSFLGWNIGKTVVGKVPGLEQSPRLGMVAVGALVVGGLIVSAYAIPPLLETRDAGMGTLGIRTDTQYFSPTLSTAKGLRLVLTNTSTTKLWENTYTWSAGYGFFIRVIPSTNDVIVLGNPVSDNTQQDIYWTFMENDSGNRTEPVRIEVRRSSPREDRTETAVLYLDWFNADIVRVRQPPGPG